MRLLAVALWGLLGSLAAKAQASEQAPGVAKQTHGAGLGRSSIEASNALIRRVIPSRAATFRVETIPTPDVFEIASRNGQIILRGNNGVAIASALYYYLTNYCHCQITWNGTNLHLPVRLPIISTPVRRHTPYQYRYYLNYCTFNYSLSWWDWTRWQKEIDWMAMHGINMPLAITGEEYTWYNVYREMGFTDADLRSFFCGPAYFSWFWMGNLDGWGGPLPLDWMKTHADLQRQIVQRERALGMTPVLPAFTGHVPAAFRTRFPQARLKTTNWHNGFADTYILDARDPLFAEIGARFIREQTRLFGTDHLYSADTFNENEPPSDDSAFLSDLSARIYQGMQRADTAAVWVMQGWLFYSDRKFWRQPQVKALLASVPDDRMILLDLAAEIEPVWKRTEAFYGKPWIWNMLNNFGGNVNLFGRMEGAARDPAEALAAASNGNGAERGGGGGDESGRGPGGAAAVPNRLSGIGLTMEAIAQNPVIYELMLQNVWQTDTIDLDTWLPQYARNRYGVANADADSAWAVLRRTVYNGQKIRDGAESIITGRPTFDSATVWTQTRLNYAPKDLLPAWDHLLKAAPVCGASDGFRFDLVDVTRQVLANYASTLQTKWVESYRKGDKAAFHLYSTQFLTLIEDMDTLLGTREDFLLGPWLRDARSWGHTPAEKALYEKNARDLITLWGDAESPLHEYANRQWSGLLRSFYKPRWAQFFQMLENGPMDGDAFDKRIKGWEWNWVCSGGTFPVVPQGDPVRVSEWIYHKYRNAIGTD